MSTRVQGPTSALAEIFAVAPFGKPSKSGASTPAPSRLPATCQNLLHRKDLQILDIIPKEKFAQALKVRLKSL